MGYNFSTLNASEESSMSDTVDQVNLWTQRLRAIAQTGLAFDPGVFDRERYEEMLALASEIAAFDGNGKTDATLAGELFARWRNEVEPGVAGYVTPKIGVGAVVFNEHDEILLIQRPSGFWVFPTGWADVGYSAAEVAAKEVREETGFEVTPTRLIALYDIRRSPESTSNIHFYSIVFYCRLVGGSLQIYPHEALAAGFFARHQLPEPLARPDLNWIEHAWAAHRGELAETYFDPA